MPDAVIGYVHGGTVQAEFCAWLARSGREFIAVRSGPNLSGGRNRLVHRFLKHTAPWLFIADTDMVFGKDVIDRLLEAADPAERPIVGALYYGLDGYGTAQPHLYELITTTSGQQGFICYRHGPQDEEILQVAATGAGALLVHRDALEKIRANAGSPAVPWFQESIIGGSLLGEDLAFCLRARDAGIPVYVHTGIRAGHMKAVMVGEVA